MLTKEIHMLPKNVALDLPACYTLGMKTFTVIIERCSETGLLVGHVPGFAGAHSQGETHEELLANLKEVVSMLLEDGDPVLDTEFVGTQTLVA
jgi:predicted RNase H-like HicB family nuclease|tara:strand:+ start:263 stop:541 length:279 start_codon:yes stop_codon:yes gene_type:complete